MSGLGMLAPNSENLSIVLGYMSLSCWIGAQFPQLLENYKRQSVDGLALPFLANWLVGDVTNLIGCILTHQLPFQARVATYFCFVDVCLVTQYIYYTRPSHLALSSPSIPSPVLPTTYATLPTRARTHSYASDFVPAPLYYGNEEAARVHRRTRSTSQSLSHIRNLRQSTPKVPNLAMSETPSHAAATTSPTSENGSEADDEVPGLMYESWHSGRSTDLTQAPGHKRSISWGPEPSPIPRRQPLSVILQPELPSTGRVDDVRGRPLTRPVYDSPIDFPSGEDVIPPEFIVEVPHSAPLVSARSRTRSAGASRRSASIVFLGFWVLFGFGRSLHPNMKASSNGGNTVGVVLDVPPAMHMSSPISSLPLEPFIDITRVHNEHPDDPGHPPPPISNERLIGRVFAWACTTLYLTSRLPQIWKNYTRQSVEGLTMSLFVCAFLANSFYVASILTNPMMNAPPPLNTDFLSESIPYILGSGGTLIFDMTIVVQSFIYRGRAPLKPLPPLLYRVDSGSTASPHLSRRRRATTLTSDEREALLARRRSAEISGPGVVHRYDSTSSTRNGHSVSAARPASLHSEDTVQQGGGK